MGKSNVVTPTESEVKSLDDLVNDLKSKQDALDKIEPHYRTAVQEHAKSLQELNKRLSQQGVRSRVVPAGGGAASQSIQRRQLSPSVAQVMEQAKAASK